MQQGLSPMSSGKGRLEEEAHAHPDLQPLPSLRFPSAL